MPIILDGTTGITTPGITNTGEFVFQGPIQVPAGSAASASVTTAAGPDTGLYFPSSSSIAITTAGTERLVVDAAGNAGLGVTPSAWNSVFKGIDLNTTGAISSYGGFGLYSAHNAFFNAAGNWIYKTSSTAGFYSITGNTHAWHIAPSGTVGNIATFTQAMTLDSSGRLFVKTTSNTQPEVLNSIELGGSGSSSSDQPHSFIRANVGTTADYSGYLVFARSRGTTDGDTTIVASGDRLGMIRFVGANGTSFSAAAEIYGAVDGTPGASNDMPGRIIFATSSDGSETPTERMRLDSSGNLDLLGAYRFTGNASDPSDSTASFYNQAFVGPTISGLNITFRTSTGGATSEQVRITSSGDVGIGTSSPAFKLDTSVPGAVISGTATIGSNMRGLRIYNTNTATTNNAIGLWLSTGPHQAGIASFRADAGAGWETTLAFYTHPAVTTNLNDCYERARITGEGDFLLGKTITDDTLTGVSLEPSQAEAYNFTQNSAGGWVVLCNRQGSDGTLIQFRQANTDEGSISVSGNTVSYNAFAGSHWSQLQDGSKPDILRGTVMESINELCEWPGETNERLPKAKISDTAGSKKVYGVFMTWDDYWTVTNDMLITSLGAFICRVNSAVTVQEGDLLESNGDGTARVQADDIIRSSTIGKVTSTVKTHQYDDGSYCVPTVLYCG